MSARRGVRKLGAFVFTWDSRHGPTTGAWGWHGEGTLVAHPRCVR